MHEHPNSSKAGGANASRCRRAPSVIVGFVGRDALTAILMRGLIRSELTAAIGLVLAGRIRLPMRSHRVAGRLDDRFGIVAAALVALEMLGDPVVARFVLGHGRYVADIALPGMKHVALVASPHPSARIRSIRTDAARAVPGVRYVLTAVGRYQLDIRARESGLSLLANRWRRRAEKLTAIAGTSAELRKLADNWVAMAEQVERLEALEKQSSSLV